MATRTASVSARYRTVRLMCVSVSTFTIFFSSSRGCPQRPSRCRYKTLHNLVAIMLSGLSWMRNPFTHRVEYRRVATMISRTIWVIDISRISIRFSCVRYAPDESVLCRIPLNEMSRPQFNGGRISQIKDESVSRFPLIRNTSRLGRSCNNFASSVGHSRMMYSAMVSV